MEGVLGAASCNTDCNMAACSTVCNMAACSTVCNMAACSTDCNNVAAILTGQSLIRCRRLDGSSPATPLIRCVRIPATP